MIEGVVKTVGPTGPSMGSSMADSAQKTSSNTPSSMSKMGSSLGPGPLSFADELLQKTTRRNMAGGSSDFKSVKVEKPVNTIISSNKPPSPVTAMNGSSSTQRAPELEKPTKTPMILPVTNRSMANQPTVTNSTAPPTVTTSNTMVNTRAAATNNGLNVRAVQKDSESPKTQLPSSFANPRTAAPTSFANPKSPSSPSSVDWTTRDWNPPASNNSAKLTQKNFPTTGSQTVPSQAPIIPARTPTNAKESKTSMNTSNHNIPTVVLNPNTVKEFERRIQNDIPMSPPPTQPPPPPPRGTPAASHTGTLRRPPPVPPSEITDVKNHGHRQDQSNTAALDYDHEFETRFRFLPIASLPGPTQWQPVSNK